MVHVYRLIFLFFVCLPSYAAVPMTDGYRLQSGGPLFPSAEQACQSEPSGGWIFDKAQFVEGAIYACYWRRDSSSPSNPYANVLRVAAAICPANSTKSDSSCTCESGFEEKNGQCVAGDKCKDVAATCAGKKGGRRNYASASGGLDAYCIPPPDDFYWDQPKYPGCNTGCTLLPSGVDVALKDDQGKTWWQGEGKFSGGTCGLVMGDDSTSPDPDNPADPSKPKEPPAKPVDERCAGQTGTVNGKEVCIPASSATGVDWTGTTKNSDGTSTEGKTVTTCSDGICESTTTKTNKDANGQVTGTTTSTDKVSQSDYCSKNSNKNSMLCAAVSGNPVPGKDNQSGGPGGGGNCTGSNCSDNNAPPGPRQPNFLGTAPPEFGVIYVAKYPDGPVKLWADKSAQLKASGLGALATNLMPKVGDGGSAPSWSLDFNFGRGLDFGVHTLEPESRIWDVIRAITILCALILARRLVFGG